MKRGTPTTPRSRSSRSSSSAAAYALSHISTAASNRTALPVLPPTRTGQLYDVIVIGGGVSGLAAASALLSARPGTTVAVLEAQDRVGGRTLSIPLPGGAFADLGGQWVGKTQTHAHALAAELGVATHAQYCDGKKVLDLQTRAQHYTGDIPLGLSPLSLLDTQLLMTRVDRLCRLAPAEHPLQSAHAREWDATSVASWMSANSTCDDTRRLATALVRGVFGVEPADLSLLHFLSYLHGGGGPDPLVNIRNGAQEATFLGGAQQLSDKMAARLGREAPYQNGSVHLNAPVDRIVDWDAARVSVHTRDGRSFSARAVIVAMPPAIARAIRFEPQLPAARDHLHQRNFIGSIIKTLVLYPRAFWRARGFSGEVVCDCVEGPAFNVYDDCLPNPDGSTQAALVVFCNGQPARDWAKRSPDERRAATLQQLVKWFGVEAAAPSAYIEKNWVDDQWTRGCPIGIWPTGALWAAGEALRAPLARLHWAGTETAAQHQGFIDGAVSAGQRAAREVVEALDTGAGAGATMVVATPSEAAASARAPQRPYRSRAALVEQIAVVLLALALVWAWLDGRLLVAWR
jgi:monoamine oxidase